MIIDDEAALRDWLVATLEPLCDAEPMALARYVLALVAKDKPLEKLRENCIDRLEVFLDRATKDFVDQLFDVIRNGRYIPEAKKENVQPKASESSEDKSGESSELLEQQVSASPEKQETERQPIPTTCQASTSSEYPTTTSSQQSSGAIIQPVKRRYPYRSSSSRHHSPNPRRHVNASSGGANRHQTSSHYRPTTNSTVQRSHRSSSRSRSISPPPAKRTQRSYSHSSTGSSSRSSPSRQTSQVNQTNQTHQPPTTNTNFLFKKIPCSDFFENKGYCALGDSCPYDHGTNALVCRQQQQQPTYYPPYQQYGIPPAHLHPHYHEYNPEAPDIKHGLHQPPPMFMRHTMHHHPRMQGPPLVPGPPPPSQQQMMMNPQRTLVTVVTNAEPLPLEQKSRQNDSGMLSGNDPPVMHTKRHVTTGPPYPNDRRTQQHDHSSNNDSNNNMNNNSSNNNNNNTHSNTNNGYVNRGWKRPWQKPDGSGSTPATLEIRKIPVEFNTISKLNEHFSKFGTVTNVQIAYDGSQDSALVAYATFHEAETAYKNPQPLFNNRFIKIFWHNSNKGQSSGNNYNSSNQQSQQQSKPTPAEAPLPKKSSNTPNPLKHHWMKMQQISANKSELTTAPPSADKSEESKSTSQLTTTTVANPPAPAKTMPIPLPSHKLNVASVTKKSHIPSAAAKKDEAKKAAMEIHRKKQGLLEEQIQRQKVLLKKLEVAEANAEKESIRALMKKADATIVMLKDSLRLAPIVKSSAVPAKPTTTTPQPTTTTATAKISQQDALKQRAQTLQKQIESLRAKTSADMRRAMSNTLGQSSLNFTNTVNENDRKIDVSTENTAQDEKQKQSQVIIKNIKDLPQNELEEYLKKSGATKIESNESDDSLIVLYPSKSHIDKIQASGLTFKNRSLNISVNDQNSSLNTSGKKRTVSETIEDELLGGASVDLSTNDDDSNEPPLKRRNQNEASDIEDNEEVDELGDDEENLLADGKKSINNDKDIDAKLSFDNEESSQQYEFESNDLVDEIQLLDS